MSRNDREKRNVLAVRGGFWHTRAFAIMGGGNAAGPEAASRCFIFCCARNRG